MDKISFLDELKGEEEFELNEEEKSVVYIPGISEVIHLVPRAYESEKEKLERKRRIARRIAESPTPEIVRNIGTVMTWFDDMGDAMTTGFWGGKGALWLASKIGLKVATRAIPYLGWVLLAKDVVDLVNFFGLPGKIFNRGKRERWRDMEINPFGKNAKLSRAMKIAKKVPGFGDILEILQTTDNLFGVGISFGPIIGFAEDLVFGVIKGAKIKPGWKESYNFEDAIIRGLESGAFVSSFGQEFSEDDHILALACLGNGYYRAKEVIEGRFNMALSAKSWDIPIYPRPLREKSSLMAVKELGFDPEKCNKYPYPGEPEALTANEMVKIIAERAPKGLAHWLKPLHRDKKGMVAGEMINEIIHNAFRVYEGEDLEIKETNDELNRWVHDLIEGKIEYPFEKSREDQEKWVREEGKKRGFEL